MPDKLTDKEIVKALECCINSNCGECPMIDTDNCDLDKLALDLINRLQANNSNLTSDLTSLQNDLTSAKAEIERLKPFEDKIAKFKSHIRVEDMLVFASSLEEWLEFCDNLKAEAYKKVEDKITELFLRYAFLHSHADMARQDYIKAVDGTEIEMQSVWDVFTLQKYGIAHYDEMNRLQTNIELMEKERLLAELEKDFRLLVKELVGEDNESI